MPSHLTRRGTLRVLTLGSAAALVAACSAPAPSAPTAASSPSSPTSAPTASTSATAAPASSAPTTSQPTAAPAAPTQVLPTAVAQPRSGGTLRAGMATDISGLEPHFSLSWTTSETTWLPYDRLTAYDLNLTPQPMLAESWDVG